MLFIAVLPELPVGSSALSTPLRWSSAPSLLPAKLPAPPWSPARVAFRPEPRWSVPPALPWCSIGVPVWPEPRWSVPPALPWWSVGVPVWPEPRWFTFTFYIYAFSRRFYPKRLTLHSSYSFYILSALAFPGNRTHDLGVARAMLYHLSYRKAVGLASYSASSALAFCSASCPLVHLRSTSLLDFFDFSLGGGLCHSLLLECP